MQRIKSLLLPLISIVFQANAQMGQPIPEPNIYVFNVFIPGEVLLKSGTKEQALLNYDPASQKIVFKRGEKDMVLTEVSTIDTVYISDRRYVPVREKVYELIKQSGDLTLLADYTLKKNSKIATTDHSGTSRKSSAEVSRTVTGVYVSRPYKGSFDREIVKKYYIRKDYKLYGANSIRQLVQIYPEKRMQIEEFVTENKVDWKNDEDLLKLFDYVKNF